ncbi:hypothetical protein ASD64_14010 [Mesorhizobium sp. Root157]|uniref:hypothetical protein n=1 Tax=Mesorhizobium sp. Root157 TaxID=1736477 RepID=UPI0006FFB778|nr:hypothetical protein [Mesorhizobium sp. Root157]KQZ99918.1 hypothetical protein ASD64_14010 [Mesorhizobium sp. Root157]
MGGLVIVGFIIDQMSSRRPTVGLEWFRGKFLGLEGTYADERRGEIVLGIYAPRLRTPISRRSKELGALLRTELTMSKPMPPVLAPGTMT